MLIVGCDYHPSFQQFAWVDLDSGECGELPLSHSNGEAERFYRNLKEQGVKVRVGIEATGHARWFERLLAELGHELWVGDAAEIKAKRVRKQKNDREDARLLRTLLVENRFPRVWLPDVDNRDLRQLLWHRHRLVQMRTRVMNQLQAVALNEGVRRKRGLWSKAGRAQQDHVGRVWAIHRVSKRSQCLERRSSLRIETMDRPALDFAPNPITLCRESHLLDLPQICSVPDHPPRCCLVAGDARFLSLSAPSELIASRLHPSNTVRKSDRRSPVFKFQT